MTVLAAGGGSLAAGAAASGEAAAGPASDAIFLSGRSDGQRNNLKVCISRHLAVMTVTRHQSPAEREIALCVLSFFFFFVFVSGV